MSALEKLDKLGVKQLHERVTTQKQGVALETVYRWRKSLITGEGVGDRIKRLLIAATVDSEEPLAWDDFCPNELRPAQEKVDGQGAVDATAGGKSS